VLKHATAHIQKRRASYWLVITKSNSFFVSLINRIKNMDIQSTKIELVKAILAIENTEFIQKIADFINKEKVDFWDELSVNEQNEIKKGIEELNSGKRVSYDSVLKKIS